jgi:hypothetical protein
MAKCTWLCTRSSICEIIFLRKIEERKLEERREDGKREEKKAIELTQLMG